MRFFSKKKPLPIVVHNITSIYEQQICEQVAQEIEADRFYLEPALTEPQVHAVLAMRMRAARIARGTNG